MLPGEDKTKERLINEVTVLRQRITELEALEAKRKQAKELVRIEKRRAEEYLKIAGVMLTTVSADENITLMNKKGCEILGYKEGELVGKNWFDTLVPERMKDEIRGVFRTLMAGNIEPVEYYENPLLTKDGEERLIAFHNTVIREPNGQIVGVLFSAEDITERKQAEEALRESEERYRALINLGGEVGEAVIMVEDTEEVVGIQTFVSDEWSRITGYSTKELLGMSFFDLVHPKDRAACLERHHRRKQGSVPGLYEISIVRKNGTEVPIEITAAVTTYKGKPANVGYIREITERKQMEEALRESEERYRDLLENANDLIQSVAPDGHFLYVNETWRNVLGYSEKEVANLTLWDIIHPDYMPHCREVFQKVISGETVSTFETVFVAKDGKLVTVEGNANCRFEGGKPVTTRGIFRNITERKQMEEKEKELQQELSLSSRLASIGELAAGVAHEINNPLTGIVGFSERLLRKSTDEKARQDLERIHNEAKRASKVVQNLLTFARRRKAKKEYADINETLGRALELRAYELRTSNIELVVELAPDLPKTMADPYQIEEVFLNIVLNAEQAMTETHNGGKLTIKTQKMKDYIKICFTDDGPGIPAEHLNKLFDPFFTTRGERGGTGLGLSVCHGIVTEHGGKTYAKSKPGKGATFFVELPLTGEKIDEVKYRY